MSQLQEQKPYTTEVEKAHATAVRKIVNEVKDFHKRQVPFRIYHGTTCTTRRLHLERDKIIDTSEMVSTAMPHPVSRISLGNRQD
jgi:hypothetical protein